MTEKTKEPDLFTIVLTSVGTEIISFRKRTKKITNEDDDFLTDAITKRIMRKLDEYKLIHSSPSGSEAWVSEVERLDGFKIRFLESEWPQKGTALLLLHPDDFKIIKEKYKDQPLPQPPIK